MAFDEESATADELWAWYVKEYESQSGIVAKLYDNFFAKLQQMLQGVPQQASVLEVGAGPCYSSRRIHAMLEGQTFAASEYDQRLVGKLQEQQLPFPVTQENVTELSFADNSFHTVICLEVLEHVADYEQALQELFRVAEHQVILSVPNEPLWRFLNMVRGSYLSDWGNTPGHINHWSPGALKRLVANHGEVVRLSRPLPWAMVQVNSPG
uniref:Methyltransferase type 11 domain-containing protein n=1 Tax=Magnetococcus massalia (strain MO-1) TaxID=451514 RepID=A0A1S7LDV3_MAGMO|nr:conserved protein of unknown function [Candidatus Magnetococcus massalia]